MLQTYLMGMGRLTDTYRYMDTHERDANASVEQLQVDVIFEKN